MADAPGFYTDGQAYDRLMGRWSRAAGQIFLDWLSLPKELDWLDVGCGTGAFTQLLLERCGPNRMSGIDPSADQIAFARARSGTSRVDFRVGDAQSLPFEDDVFDAVVMALVITFLADPAKALAEMSRVTRSGGTVATYMWDMTGGGFTQQPLRDAMEAMGVTPGASPGVEHSRLDALNTFFETAGLEDVSVRTIEIQLAFADFDDYWASETGFANPTVKPLLALPPREIERLRASLRERLPTDGNGRIAYMAWANAIKGCVPGQGSKKETANV